MDILDSLRQAPSAELYRLYLAIGKMLDDPRRILEVRQRLHLGMEVSYIGGDPLAPPSHGTVVELRQTQAVIQDNQSRQRWSVLYAAVIPDTVSGPTPAPASPPPRAQREEFFIGDTVGFTDKHLSERVGIIVRLNAKKLRLSPSMIRKATGGSLTLCCERSSTSNPSTPSTRVPLTDTDISCYRRVEFRARQ
jgi:hypothetical protein